MARRKIDHAAAKQAAVSAVRSGLDLVGASRCVGIHAATVYRWRASDEQFRDAIADAQYAADLTREWLVGDPENRPSVPWRNQCPECLAKVVVRTAKGGARFWRCGRWPHCLWASWRPRHPRNCRACGGPRFWSHSRKSIVCDHCGMRKTAP